MLADQRPAKQGCASCCASVLEPPIKWFPVSPLQLLQLYCKHSLPCLSPGTCGTSAGFGLQPQLASEGRRLAKLCWLPATYTGALGPSAHQPLAKGMLLPFQGFSRTGQPTLAVPEADPFPTPCPCVKQQC